MTLSNPSLPEQKQRLRLEMRAKRQTYAAKNINASNKLADLLLVDLKLQTDQIVSAYYAFRDEMDPAPLTAGLRERGHKTALPVLTEKGQALLFRLYEPGDQLVLNGMGIMQPLDTAPLVEPDVLLVPMLAFDTTRHRLGYGGGFYDRTLAGLRARKSITAIGIAYACQEVPTVPIEAWDGQLDKVATEVKIF